MNGINGSTSKEVGANVGEVLECRTDDPLKSSSVKKQQQDSIVAHRAPETRAPSRIEQFLTPLLTSLHRGESTEIELSAEIALEYAAGAKGKVKITCEKDGTYTVELLAEAEVGGKLKDPTGGTKGENARSQGDHKASAKAGVMLAVGTTFNLKTARDAADLIDAMASVGVVVSATGGAQQLLQMVGVLGSNAGERLQRHLTENLTKAKIEVGLQANFTGSVEAFCFEMGIKLDASVKLSVEYDKKKSALIVVGKAGGAVAGNFDVGTQRDAISFGAKAGAESKIQIEIPLGASSPFDVNAISMISLLQQPEVKALFVSTLEGKLDLSAKHNVKTEVPFKEKNSSNVEIAGKWKEVFTYDLKNGIDQGTKNSVTVEVSAKHSDNIDLKVAEFNSTAKNMRTYEGKSLDEVWAHIDRDLALENSMQHHMLRTIGENVYPRAKKGPSPSGT